jgi:hypothetical protein
MMLECPIAAGFGKLKNSFDLVLMFRWLRVQILNLAALQFCQPGTVKKQNPSNPLRLLGF